LVHIGSVAGTVVATVSQGFVSIMGQVGYSGDRLSGKVTLVATDEATARDITLAKPTAGGDVPIELPGPDKPAKPGKRAFCGWGQLTFRVTDWLAGSATVIINSKGQATIVGEIAPPKEFILFEQKEWDKRLFKLEIKAGYGIPVVGQVGVYANISLNAIATVGPGKLYNIKLSGVYSTDPRVAKNLTIEGTLNISAFAGLKLRAEAGFFVTILAHDIKVGAGLDATAGVRGYVEATPRIGMREKAPGGKREYFIQGHLEIAAQPVLGFSGDLFVTLDTPWWSPLSDKTWKWPLFSLEYPLPGEFGIGADVDYVLGSKQWPTIEFGEVNFDSSKFMSDIMNDNTDKGGGKEQKKKGDWGEGLGAKGKGGAKNKGGAGKTPGDINDDLGPIGEEETFSDGKETHRLWFEQKGATATLMMASSSPGRADRKLAAYKESILLLYEGDQGKANTLLQEALAHLKTVGDEATQLAAMKLATRKAREVYESNKDKPRKRSRQKGKDGGKELAKKVKADEQSLRDPVSKLALLLLEVAFKPIHRTARMHKGEESIDIANDRDHAGLQLGKVKSAQKLSDAAAAGPLSVGKNKAGRNFVKSVHDKATKIESRIGKAKTRFGKINAGVYKTLEEPADELQKLIASLGNTMKVRNLQRLLTVPIEKMPPVEPVQFPVSPAKLLAKAKKRKKRWLYRDTFIEEMRRQVELQNRGLNELSVDRWVFQINLYSLDRKRFLQMDHSARIEVLDELKLRAESALETTRTRQGQLKAALEAVNRALAATSAGIPAAPSEATVAEVTGRTGGEKQYREQLKRVTLERMKEAGLKKKEQLGIFERILKSQKQWKAIAGNASQLVILHNPDQVGGGYDFFPPPPDPPTDPRDENAWLTYIEKLLEHVGPRDVNSKIGGEWPRQIGAAYKRVTAVVPQESYPINKMNLPLEVRET
jgi:hypothetical protein